MPCYLVEIDSVHQCKHNDFGLSSIDDSGQQSYREPPLISLRKFICAAHKAQLMSKMAMDEQEIYSIFFGPTHFHLDELHSFQLFNPNRELGRLVNKVESISECTLFSWLFFSENTVKFGETNGYLSQ